GEPLLDGGMRVLVLRADHQPSPLHRAERGPQAFAELPVLRGGEEARGAQPFHVTQAPQHVEPDEVAVPVAVVADGEVEEAGVELTVGRPESFSTDRRNDGRTDSHLPPHFPPFRLSAFPLHPNTPRTGSAK